MPSSFARHKSAVIAGLMAACLGGAMPAHAAAGDSATEALRQRPAQDEIVYFLLPDRFANGDPANDRGGLSGDRLTTGYDPTDKAFYHGGDLAGLIDRLDYIKGLGATAIWVGPVFRNRPVQGAPGQESAGYHGYWITDFTRIDPHFGTNADFARLVAAAHARGLKVYMDIVVNHTADVIHYRECPGASPCPYRSRADYPYQRQGGPGGAAINLGFLGDDVRGNDAPGADNWAHLTRPDYAYTPLIDPAQAHVKVPDWLNDPIYYHNRGNSTFTGESSTMGDFSGLDDVMTEHPRVIAGMIAIYSDWITRYGIDGYRIDTARHVDPAFWRAFIPAIRDVAAKAGIPHFAVFGEVAGDAGNAPKQAAFTHVAAFPATLDFGFRRAVIDAVSGKTGTDALEDLFANDPLYAGGEDAAREQVTFVSNHDNGRIGWSLRKALPEADDAQILARSTLASAMLMTLRGVPAIYAGDEQGFAGIGTMTGEDQNAREDQFGSRVAAFNAEKLIGTAATTAQPRFDRDHPLYRAIATFAALRRDIPALRRGRQVIRARSATPGLFAVTRADPADGHEVLIAFNTATTPIEANVALSARATALRSRYGTCPAAPAAPGTVHLTLPPLGTLICETDR